MHVRESAAAKRGHWATGSFDHGVFTPIGDLVRPGCRHRLELWGNGADGWAVYLIDGNAALLISPCFHRDFGDTRRDALDAAVRAFGVRPKVARDHAYL
ncbi:MAG: hypothetical protein P4M09_22880 [Devosia sp.]|nr:hypothetical protein [Devosia sp.]